MFARGALRVSGWALNISRGGLRAILDKAVPLGELFQISLGDQDKRAGRIAWVREEPDGAIVGVAFEGTSAFSEVAASEAPCEASEVDDPSALPEAVDGRVMKVHKKVDDVWGS